jgi:hypothetical protein
MTIRAEAARGGRQHYLPAAYLGRFSWKTSKRPRNRPLWVRDLRSRRPYIRSAEDVAWELGLYDVRDDSLGQAGTADVTWGYERQLSRAIDALEDKRSPLDGRLWLCALVPFVASLFVRGPDFPEEHEQRLTPGVRETIGGSSRDNGTAARLIQFQELLAPVMAAEWHVAHFPADVDLITNDIGYSVASTPDGEGYVVPLSRTTALVILGSSSRTVLKWENGAWIAPIDHRPLPAQEVPRLRMALGNFARLSVFGPTEAAVVQGAAKLGTAPKESDSILLGGSATGVDLECHLYDYFRVLSALRQSPETAQAAADEIDWAAVAETWTGHVAVEVLFTEERMGGVHVEGGQIALDLAFGIASRKARRAAGDFRRGARTLAELDWIRNAPTNIGRIDRMF